MNLITFQMNIIYVSRTACGGYYARLQVRVSISRKYGTHSTLSHTSETLTLTSHTLITVLVEIIRDSKNKYFFQRSRIIWSKFQDRELLGSRIIRHVHVRVRIRIIMCAQVQPRFVSRATTTLWSRRSRRKRLNRQSRLHCLPDKFLHLGHGPRCDSDGLGPERRPNGP